MTVEEKVIAKIRAMLLADTIVKGYVDGRIYPSHVSTIDKPVYPAISIHLMPSRAMFAERGYVDINIQIDGWIPMALYTFKDAQKLQDRFRTLFDRQKINDANIGVYGFGVEVRVGPTMVEDDTRLLHIPAVYKFTAASK